MPNISWNFRLGRRYEVIGDKFTASFRKHSRQWGTGIAFVLALVINIDSIHIADLYINNESMRQGVIVQKDAFVEDYDALLEALEKDESIDSVTKNELVDAFKKSREQLDVVTSVGLPVGWSYFPHSECPWLSGQKADSENLKSKNEIEDGRKLDDLTHWLIWLLGIIITALLAGLGAPFWYDAVIRISRVAQRARGAKNPAP